jgi:hypothetical protein
MGIKQSDIGYRKSPRPQGLVSVPSMDTWPYNEHFTARAAALLGFRGVAVSDEQGTAYLIDMAGREGELERV